MSLWIRPEPKAKLNKLSQFSSSKLNVLVSVGNFLIEIRSNYLEVVFPCIIHVKQACIVSRLRSISRLFFYKELHETILLLPPKKDHLLWQFWGFYLLKDRILQTKNLFLINPGKISNKPNLISCLTTSYTLSITNQWIIDFNIIRFWSCVLNA